MQIIKLFCFDSCFLILPITIYLIFFDSKNNLNNKKKERLLEILLYVTTFLLLSLYSEMQINYYLIILSIPTLIAFHFKKTVPSIIITTMTLLFFYENINNNIVYLCILFISYYIPYFMFKKNNNRILLSTMFVIVNEIYFYVNFHNYFYQFLVISILYILTIYLYTYILTSIKYMDKNNKRTLLKILHEIKNPLFVLKGYLSFDNKDINNYKDILSTETDHALKILEDLRDLNHLKTNKVLFNIRDLLEEINNILLPIAVTKNITYNCKCNINEKIYADYNRIKQVLVNIIKNSLEELNNNGKLSISCSKKNNELLIKIKDNGCGMTEEEINNLFIPFNSKKDYGTGIGLCLSKEIIDVHNGKLYYTSIKDKYTVANILLPISNNMDSNSMV